MIRIARVISRAAVVVLTFSLWCEAAPPTANGAKPTTRPVTKPAKKTASGASASLPEGQQDTSAAASRLGRATSQPAAGMPAISREDQVLLAKTASRAFLREMAGEPERGSMYCPPALKGRTGIVHLTLRQYGGVVAEATSKEEPVVVAANAAGVLLAQAAKDAAKRSVERAAERKGIPIDPTAASSGLEFELSGPREYLTEGLTDTQQWSDALLHAFEPAKEGIGVEFHHRRGWTRPSEIVSLNYTPDLALQKAEAMIELRHMDKVNHAKEIRYFRFESCHLWQPSLFELPTLLVRGETLVTQESVTCEAIDEAILRMGSYLHYRQNSDGWFSHEYLPTPDRYSTGNVARVQMRSLAGLAEYAQWSGRPDVMEDAITGITKTAEFLHPMSVVSVSDQGKPHADECGVVLFFPGHEDYLENSAWFLMATVSAAQDSEWDAKRIGLTVAVLGAQEDVGRFRMEFAPKEDDSADSPWAAGWAVLALARSAAWRPDASIEPAIARGLDYYGPLMHEQATPIGLAPLAIGFSAGYSLTNDAKASDAVFSVLDRCVARQVTAEVCPWEELHGAINAGTPGMVGVDTATYLAALADGLELARRVGDKARVQRYEEAVLSAARFVLQLEVRPAGAYYVRNRRDALGGVRVALWDNRIRVDHCAAALSGLIHARRALYGERGAK